MLIWGIYMITLPKKLFAFCSRKWCGDRRREKKIKDAADEKVKDMKVDLDGIKECFCAPVRRHHYGVTAVDDKVYYTAMSSSSRGTSMKMYDWKKEDRFG